MFLLISSVLSVNFSFGQAPEEFPQSIIVSSSTDTTPHLLKLKATQQGSTETLVSGFNLDATNAVGAQANSQLLILVTDSSVRVIEAKVRTASDQVIDLIPTTSQQATNTFSLTNLAAGVYTLDVTPFLWSYRIRFATYMLAIIPVKLLAFSTPLGDKSIFAINSIDPFIATKDTFILQDFYLMNWHKYHH
jgi:hypothetical protein